MFLYEKNKNIKQKNKIDIVKDKFQLPYNVSKYPVQEIKKVKNFQTQSEIVNSIVVGDCFEVMKKIDNNTFDMIFADPPYNMQLQNELYRPNNTKVNGVNDEWDHFVSFEHYDCFTTIWISI